MRRSIGTSSSFLGLLFEPDGPVTGDFLSESLEEDEGSEAGVAEAVLSGFLTGLALIVAVLEFEEALLAFGDDSSIRRLPIEDETSDTKER